MVSYVQHLAPVAAVGGVSGPVTPVAGPLRWPYSQRMAKYHFTPVWDATLQRWSQEPIEEVATIVEDTGDLWGVREPEPQYWADRAQAERDWADLLTAMGQTP